MSNSKEEKFNKYEALHKLKEEMEKDEKLPLKKVATNLVFGHGNTNAKVVCIGEGPGFNEDKQGFPFVGQAGKLLDKLLPLSGLERKDVFITNIVHHRPPENRDPEPDEILAYGKYLDKIIEIIDPKVIITLGRYSMAKFLPGVYISGVHGARYDIIWKGKGLTVVPMYHPAASLRNGNILEQEKNDFVKLKEILKKVFDDEAKKEKESKLSVEQESLI